MQNKLDTIITVEEYRRLKEKEQILDNLNDSKIVSRIGISYYSFMPNYEIVVYNTDETINLLKNEIEQNLKEFNLLNRRMVEAYNLIFKITNNNIISWVIKKLGFTPTVDELKKTLRTY